MCRCGTILRVITASQPIWTAWTTSFFEPTCQKMKLPDMVSVPLHKQITSPLWRDILVLLKSMATLTLTSMRPLLYSAIPFKTELKSMNKSQSSFVLVRGSGELDREDPSSYIKYFIWEMPAVAVWFIASHVALEGLSLDRCPLVMQRKALGHLQRRVRLGNFNMLRAAQGVSGLEWEWGGWD